VRYAHNTNLRSRFFDPAARAAGLPGLTPHELRRTAASLAVAAGANVKMVQLVLGHALAAMTLDVYAGLFAEVLDAVADPLDAPTRGRVRTRWDCGLRGHGHRAGAEAGCRV
jgi:integrase